MNNIAPEVAAKVQDFANLAERGLKQNLVARHPELRLVSQDDDIRNAQAIDAIFLERVQTGWKFTDEHYEAAYCMALENGQLTLPDPGTIEAAANAVYPAFGIPRQDADGRLIYPPATAGEFLRTAPLAKVAAYMKQKFEVPRPPNMWE
jgi:hypothetical protein